MDQLIQVIGAVLILAAFAAAQRGGLSQNSRTYLVLNLLGSTALAAVAAWDSQYGFLLLEGCWALISASSLMRRLRRH
jgi:hypothetical protein